MAAAINVAGLCKGISCTQFEAMVDGCTLPEIRAKFRSLAKLNPRALRAEVGSATRLVNAVFRSPHFLVRCDGEFDIHAFVKAKGKLIVEKGDGKAIADGMFIRRGAKLFVEVDNEHMSPKQMREKWARYGNSVDGFILLICRTTGRLRRLMKSSDRVKNFIFFSRFDWLRMENVREKWIDSFGKRAEI